MRFIIYILRYVHEEFLEQKAPSSAARSWSGTATETGLIKDDNQVGFSTSCLIYGTRSTVLLSASPEVGRHCEIYTVKISFYTIIPQRNDRGLTRVLTHVFLAR